MRCPWPFVFKMVNVAYRFHPDFYDGKSKVQSTMLGYMHQWVENLGVNKRSIFERLTKQSVREHKNVLRQGEMGVSRALVNPLGLPTLEDLTSKLPPPPGVRASVVGTHEGKPVYFSADVYGKGGDTSPVSRGIGTSPSFASSYSPSIADSEASSKDQQDYQWTPGLPREKEGSISESTEDFYSAYGSDSSPATSGFYSPPPDPPRSTEDFYSARPGPHRAVSAGHIPQERGPSRSAMDFYSSPGPNPPPFQGPAPGPPHPGNQTSENPFLPQTSSPSQPQSRGMDFYSQSPPQSPYPPYNPYPPQIPQISPEAASFYASPPPQPPQPVSKPMGQRAAAIPRSVGGRDDQTDPLAELTASLRKF